MFQLYDPIGNNDLLNVTELGISMLVKFSQHSKAYVSMRVTELGMTMLFKPVQSQNAYPPILVTLSGMTVVAQPATSVFFSVSIIALQLLRES